MVHGQHLCLVFDDDAQISSGHEGEGEQNVSLSLYLCSVQAGLNMKAKGNSW